MKNSTNSSARLATLKMAESAARSAFACNFETAEAFEAKRIEDWHKAHRILAIFRIIAWFKRLFFVKIRFQNA